MTHILFWFYASLYSWSLADPLAPHYALEEAEFHFKEFVNKFNKEYADEQQKATRFEIFKSNLETINQMNKRSKHATYGITPHLDLSTEEFLKMASGLNAGDRKPIPCDTVLKDDDVHDIDAPESYDWREQGAVTEVKDQGDCGSCYAFSAIANVESQYFIKHKKLLELSEQEIIDCDQTSNGCDGGLMSNALRALKNLGGAALESDYPYEEGVGECQFNKSKIAAKLSGCISMDLKSQEKLKQLLYKNGPIAVGIDPQALHGYTGGIVEDYECSTTPSHALLLVGYGIDAKEYDQPYWILKNSWGKNFGEGGYFRLQRSNKPYGACGLMNHFMASAIVE